MNRHERRKVPSAHIEIVSEKPDELDMYVVYDGKRIAKRGYPETPQARTWISLEPGYVVRLTGPQLLYCRGLRRACALSMPKLMNREPDRRDNCSPPERSRS
jgi:hypothetical protein